MSHYSDKTATGYTMPRLYPSPLCIKVPSAYIPNPTEDELTNFGWLDGKTRFPADPPPALVSGQKYGDPQLVNGRVVVYVIQKKTSELLAEMKQQGEFAVSAHIQTRVDAYNEAHGLAFEDVHACSNYRDVAGYTHRQFCDDVWMWNVAVWETARQIMVDVVSGSRFAPTEDELIAELPVYGGSV